MWGWRLQGWGLWVGKRIMGLGAVSGAGGYGVVVMGLGALGGAGGCGAGGCGLWGCRLWGWGLCAMLWFMGL